MTTNILRASIVALGLAASPAMLMAQDNSIAGVWDVSVTVKNCQTGALIRNVRSLQMFQPDGSLRETADTASRGISLGTWSHGQGDTWQAQFWFFRYNRDGSFASFAKSVETITLNNSGGEFSASGTVQDFDANNSPISSGCFTHIASRLDSPAATSHPAK